MSISIERPPDLFATAQTHFAAGRYGLARDIYTHLLHRNERDHAAHLNLAQCFKRLGEWPLATRHFRAGFDLRRRSDTPTPAPLTAFYVEHLSEQLAHLRANSLDANVTTQLARMARLLRDCYGPHRSGPLPVPFDAGILKLVHGCAKLPDPIVPPASFNPTPKLTSIPLGRDDDAIHILDDVLNEEALITLRDFLTNATIWYDVRPERGYLGAHLHDGLAGDLLSCLIAEAAECIGRFVGAVQIIQVWAFKYAPTAPGIDLHADQATWNLNLWPTPSSANLDPASGGMTITKFRVPEDWTFALYNASPDRHRTMIAAENIEQVTIPYRGNRAVLFPSRYLHKTDDVRFAADYDLRRINMTFMADPA